MQGGANLEEAKWEQIPGIGNLRHLMKLLLLRTIETGLNSKETGKGDPR